MMNKGTKRWNFCCSVMVGIKGVAELIISLGIKLVCLHEALLLSPESAIKIALERRFCGCLEEEKICQKEMEGGHKEAYRLHNIPI